MFFFFFFSSLSAHDVFFNGMGGQRGGDVTDVGFYPINVFQLHCNRILARFVIVDITRPVRSQVRASILVIRYFVFPFFFKKKKLSARAYARKERKKAPPSVTYPSYSPTAFCTNSSVSSGSSSGREAGVRSILESIEVWSSAGGEPTIKCN